MSSSSRRRWAAIEPLISPNSKKFIQKLGFKKMSPVQAIAIPLFLNNKDVLVEACTGSGKTLAFLIPAIELCAKAVGAGKSDEELEVEQEQHHCSLGALILVPTRELATQIYTILQDYVAFFETQLVCQSFVGGARPVAEDCKIWQSLHGPTEKQSRSLIVATPGRLVHLWRELAEKCEAEKIRGWMKDLEVLILDEADRLLEMGFEQEVGEIVAKLPKQRRTGLFSATLSGSELGRLAFAVRNPVRVTVENVSQGEAKSAEAKKVEGDHENTAIADAEIEDGEARAEKSGEEAVAPAPKNAVPESLKNYFLELSPAQKLPFLQQLFTRKKKSTNDASNQNPFLAAAPGKTIVFFLTCASVDLYATLLRNLGVKLEKMHGKMAQKARDKSFAKFRKGEVDILLATDVLARGIDVPDIDLIVQFDPPCDPASYVHRIGRTARAGQAGRSLLLLLENEIAYVPFLEKRGVKLSEVEYSAGAEAVSNVKSKTEALVRSDRQVMVQGSKAFVSFVRAYQEHQLAFLFRVDELDLGGVATSMGLLRLPRMKEILSKKINNFVQSEVDPDTIPFKDKVREQRRQERMKKEKEERESGEKVSGKGGKKGKGKGAAAPAAADKAQEEGQDVGADGKVLKHTAVVEKHKRTRGEKRKAGRKNRLDEWQALQMEECLAKKLRKGKISKKEFAKELQKIRKAEQGGSDSDGGGFGGSDSSDDDSDDADGAPGGGGAESSDGDFSDSDSDAGGKSAGKKKSAEKSSGKQDSDSDSEMSEEDSDDDLSEEEPGPKKRTAAQEPAGPKTKRRKINRKNKNKKR